MSAVKNPSAPKVQSQCWLKCQVALTYLLIVRPNVTWTSAIRVFLTHLNTETDRQTRKGWNKSIQTQLQFTVSLPQTDLQFLHVTVALRFLCAGLLIWKICIDIKESSQQWWRIVPLTSSEFKDLSYEHEAGLGQGVSPPISVVTVVWQVAVVISLLLRTSKYTQQTASKWRRLS